MKLDIRKENAELLGTRTIDGREYLLVPLSDVTVNGIRIRAKD